MEKSVVTASTGFTVTVPGTLPRVVLEALVQGSYEWAEIELVKRFIEPTDRVLEVGTSLGVVTLTLAQIIGPTSIVTFDINPEVINSAQATFKKNNISIDVRLAALVSRRQYSRRWLRSIPFDISKDSLASCKTSVLRWSYGKKIYVKIDSLENVINSHNANCLVIDAEGSEWDILYEADLSEIDKIIIEFHPDIMGQKRCSMLLWSIIEKGFQVAAHIVEANVFCFRKIITRPS